MVSFGTPACRISGEITVADRPLIDYQLKLQSDEEELAEFRKGGETMRATSIRNRIPDGIRTRFTLEWSRGSGAHRNLAGGV